MSAKGLEPEKFAKSAEKSVDNSITGPKPGDLLNISQYSDDGNTHYTHRGIRGIDLEVKFRLTEEPRAYQSSRDARRAPSTMADSLAQAMLVSTLRPQAEVPKPQSLPAMTFSRPTILA